LKVYTQLERDDHSGNDAKDPVFSVRFSIEAETSAAHEFAQAQGDRERERELTGAPVS
jgi:hypothetical protein